MSHSEENDESDHNDDEGTPPTLNPQATPFIPQSPIVQNVVSGDKDLSASTPLLSSLGNMSRPTIPSASNTLETLLHQEGTYIWLRPIHHLKC